MTTDVCGVVVCVPFSYSKCTHNFMMCRMHMNASGQFSQSWWILREYLDVIFLPLLWLHLQLLSPGRRQGTSLHPRQSWTHRMCTNAYVHILCQEERQSSHVTAGVSEQGGQSPIDFVSHTRQQLHFLTWCCTPGGKWKVWWSALEDGSWSCMPFEMAVKSMQMKCEEKKRGGWGQCCVYWEGHQLPMTLWISQAAAKQNKIIAAK